MSPNLYSLETYVLFQLELLQAHVLRFTLVIMAYLDRKDLNLQSSSIIMIKLSKTDEETINRIDNYISILNKKVN